MASVLRDEENFNEVLFSIQSLNVASNFNQNDYPQRTNNFISKFCQYFN